MYMPFLYLCPCHPEQSEGSDTLKEYQRVFVRLKLTGTSFRESSMLLK